MIKITWILRFFVYFANRTKEVRDYIQDLTSKIAFDIKGEKPFYFEFADGRIRLKNGVLENPDVTLKTDSNSFSKVLTGRMSQEEAFDKRLIVPQGAIVEAIRFRYVVNKVLERNKMLKCLRAFSSLM
jgi:putative sterol carrier protein